MKEERYTSKQKRGKVKGCLTVIVVIVAIGFIDSCFKPSQTNVTQVSTAVASKSTPTEKFAESTGEKNNTTLENQDSNVPAEYKSALNKANTYSKTMYMSKSGIYNQLTSEYGEQFSVEAAQYAMKSMEADWNINALKKAETYSDTMYMSKAGIYEQLISEYGEQFTEEEAKYAIDNVEADWKKNALEKAKVYQSTMDMSPAAIHEQLISEYGEKFTKEEADYAIAHLE